MNHNHTYRPLGDFIRPIDNRNKDLSVTKLLGLSIEKCFIPSIANTIGTDMSSYKIVKQNQFAYGPVTSRNGDKITIALYTDSDNAIISQAYSVFEITKPEELMPQYLMLWFSRPEFDRYARYKSHGSAREIFDWQTMCETMIPVPPISEQEKIVHEYETVQRRIDNNRQLINKLEDTAQTLYKKMFVEGIDKENLPEGWRMGRIEEYCQDIKSGGTPSRTSNEYWNSKDHPWLKSGEVHNNVITKVEEYISASGLKNSSAKLIPEGAVIMAMYGATAGQVGYLACETSTNQACCNMICKSKEDSAFLFFHLIYNQEEIKRLANGGAQENLSQELIASQPIIISPDNESKHKFSIILHEMILKYIEIDYLTEFKSILLAKMGR